jgi:citrate synthase
MAKTITHIDNDETKPALFGERDHMEAAKSMDFAEMIFEVLTEKKPSGAELKLLNLILNLSIDHGPNSPSAVATIDAAKGEETMGESVGAGMAQIGDRHGGAGGPLMEIMYKIQKGETTSEEVIKDLIISEKRLPGVGHRVYKDFDPRAQLILKQLLKTE